MKVYFNLISIAVLCSCSSTMLVTPPDNVFVDKNIGNIKTTKLTPENVKIINSQYKDEYKIDSKFFEFTEEPKKIQVGDAIELLIWEAYPPLLFTSPVASGSGSNQLVNSSNLIPAQTVNSMGMIDVPFIGLIEVVNMNEFE